MNESSPQATTDRTGDARLRREARLLTIATVIGLGLAVYLALGNNQSAAGVADRMARAQDLASDLRAIRQVRHTSHGSIELVAGKADVLDRVASAMRSAGLEPTTLVSTQPQAPRPIPGTAIAEVEIRLIFTNLTLEALVRFADALKGHDGSYRVVGIVIRAADDKRWNADVTIGIRALSADIARARQEN